MTIRRAIRGSLLALAALTAACAPREKDRIALVGGNIIDGTGGPVLRDGVIVVYQGHIETIAPREGFKIPKSAAAIDVTGEWIIPGLIDSHVHVARWALPRFLAYGVTTVRDTHGQMDSIMALREEAGLGGNPWPRIYAAGAMIDGAPATYSNATQVTTPDQARRAVDARAVAGVDFIKVYTRITPELFKALLDEANSLNLKVSAHLGLTDAETASRLGVASIEHMTGVPEAANPKGAQKLYAEHKASFFRGWNAFERSWATLDSSSLARVAATLVERKVVMVPTLVLHETFSRLDDPALLLSPDLKAVPDSELHRWDIPDLKKRAGWTDADYAAFRASRPAQDLFIREFRVAGGIIAAGTDATNQMLVPGLSLHSEMELLVNAGLSASDALRTATANGALLIGADSIGTLTAGHVADLVVLDASPLSDIRNTRKVTRVMVRGLLFDADSIRKSW
jgi:imidazolonepropionase-like amidohydrolase